jgi:hypothetical protein
VALPPEKQDTSRMTELDQHGWMQLWRAICAFAE